jgi:hypothetical protein
VCGIEAGCPSSCPLFAPSRATLPSVTSTFVASLFNETRVAGGALEQLDYIAPSFKGQTRSPEIWREAKPSLRFSVLPIRRSLDLPASGTNCRAALWHSNCFFEFSTFRLPGSTYKGFRRSRIDADDARSRKGASTAGAHRLDFTPQGEIREAFDWPFCEGYSNFGSGPCSLAMALPSCNRCTEDLLKGGSEQHAGGRIASTVGMQRFCLR